MTVPIGTAVFIPIASLCLVIAHFNQRKVAGLMNGHDRAKRRLVMIGFLSGGGRRNVAEGISPKIAR